MDVIVTWWASHVFLPDWLSVMVVSMIPVVEERGGLILARLLNMPLSSAVFWCVIGNMIPIPFILFGIQWLLKWMDEHHFSKIASWIRRKAEKNRPKIEKYGYLGLILFVGIPLPGTGAWTGTLVAALFGMDPKKASICVLIGVLLAAFIMTVISYGFMGTVIS